MAKNDVFVLNKAKNGPQRPYTRPKGLKMYEKGQKVFGRKIPAFPELTENHCAKKRLD